MLFINTLWKRAIKAGMSQVTTLIPIVTILWWQIQLTLKGIFLIQKFCFTLTHLTQL